MKIKIFILLILIALFASCGSNNSQNTNTSSNNIENTDKNSQNENNKEESKDENNDSQNENNKEESKDEDDDSQSESSKEESKDEDDDSQNENNKEETTSDSQIEIGRIKGDLDNTKEGFCKYQTVEDQKDFVFDLPSTWKWIFIRDYKFETPYMLINNEKVKLEKIDVSDLYEWYNIPTIENGKIEMDLKVNPNAPKTGTLKVIVDEKVVETFDIIASCGA